VAPGLRAARRRHDDSPERPQRMLDDASELL